LLQGGLAVRAAEDLARVGVEVAVVVVVLDLHPPGEPGIGLVQPGPDRLGKGQVLLRVGLERSPTTKRIRAVRFPPISITASPGSSTSGSASRCTSMTARIRSLAARTCRTVSRLLA